MSPCTVALRRGFSGDTPAGSPPRPSWDHGKQAGVSQARTHSWMKTLRFQETGTHTSTSQCRDKWIPCKDEQTWQKELLPSRVIVKRFTIEMLIFTRDNSK